MRKQVFLLSFLMLLVSFASAARAATSESASVSERIPYGRAGSVNMGLDLQYVPVQYRNYSWLNSRTSNETGHGFHLALEWIAFDEPFGKFGVGGGAGFYAIKNVTFDNQRATLTAFPLESYLSYRFDYFENQMLVPFVKAGLSATLVRQRGIEIPGTQTYRGFDYSGGVSLCLNNIDQKSAKQLDMSTGINATYIVFEYLRSQHLGEEQGPNLTRDEYRLGLRFEM